MLKCTKTPAAVSDRWSQHFVRVAASTPMASTVTPSTASDFPIDRQHKAFSSLYDTASGRLKRWLWEDDAQEALLEINTLAAISMKGLKSAMRFSATTTICHGTCLIVAVLDDLALLKTAWTGPDSELKHLVSRTMRDFGGNTSQTVRCRMLCTVYTRYAHCACTICCA